MTETAPDLANTVAGEGAVSHARVLTLWRMWLT